MPGALSAESGGAGARPAEWLQRDHELLCRTVREAGRVAAEYFRLNLAGWDKSPGDPVSQADLAVDANMREALLGARPGYGWLSEESAESADRMTAERVWVVDPIDGTRAFLQGRAEYSVAAALLVGEKPVAGAVYNPETEEFYEALAGTGARLNGRPIQVAHRRRPEGMTLVVSRREYDKVFRAANLSRCTIQRVSSIAYKIARVASGEADACLALSGKSDWDLVAAHLLIHEAGGVMTRADGEPLSYNRARPRHASVLAANPHLHARLVARLRLR